MAQLNIANPKIHTAEGGVAKRINPEQQLRRSIMACMLWEDSFYEDGQSIGERISNIIPKVKADMVYQIATEARTKMKLRHAPLLVAREMARLDSHKHFVAQTLTDIIQRPDELAEFLSIYWKEKRQPLSAQVKKGLARAFIKFNEYSLAKYNNQDRAIKLRDVLFLCHAKPKDDAQASLWKKLVDNTLAIPDTWEVALSAGGDKKEIWERLLKEQKLGALALLRNLRNMREANVDEKLIFTAIREMQTERVLPFRFISAARYAPQWEEVLEQAMFKCVASQEKIPGKTILLVDVSGSMDNPISSKSDLRRIDAACALAILIREICEQGIITTFSKALCEIPARRGFALRDAIVSSQEHAGTYLGHALSFIHDPKNGHFNKYTRLIVITDEQSHDTVPDASGRGYVINVSCEKNGIGYGKWIHIDGWSEAILDYIKEYERAVA